MPISTGYSNDTNIILREIAAYSSTLAKQYNINMQKKLAGLGQFGTMFSEPIKTDTEDVRIDFDLLWDEMKDLGLHADPKYKTILGNTIQRSIGRAQIGFEYDLFLWRKQAAKAALMKRVNAAASTAGLYRSRKLIYMLENGTDIDIAPCYDEQPLFSITHDFTGLGNTWSNLKTTIPLDSDGIDTVYQIFQSIPLGEKGEPLPVDDAKFWIVCHPKNRTNVLQALRSTSLPKEEFSSGVFNPVANLAEPFVTNLLTNQDDWYMIMQTEGFKPFITVHNPIGTRGMRTFASENDIHVRDNNFVRFDMQLCEKSWPMHAFTVVKVDNT